MIEREIFVAAVSRSDLSERAAFLDAACGDDADLRRRLDLLLTAHDQAREFLEVPAAAVAATVLHPAHETTETVIAGRYTLQEKIGEGGMGTVWVARQTEPVKRKVALKLIKAGMDSKAVVQRFEQERQALALMDHPNIAKVLDGGITDEGRPFFVMELVNGLPLTKFCDGTKLGIRERLELFIPICQAVQHAHQKGIVHRDLKPSNILVTLYDGRPIPKVIDFGVAKATGGKLTEETMSTQFGAVVGTLEYMSPEQAGFSAADVDTRADIYSLGVILYELLTGLKPFDSQRLKEAALDELIRIIRDEEPSKPSTRLSTDASLPSLAAMRQIEPARLTKLLRGELDWVVMKCLEKQRDRRYETANALARDVQRYLADETVEARPPSAGYRLTKLLRRNKGPVLAASMVLLALIGGVIGTTLGLFEAERQEELAIAAHKDEQHQREEAQKQTSIARQQAQIADAALREEHAAKMQAVEAAQKEEQERIKTQRQLRISTAERLAALSHTKRTESPEVSLLLAVESGRATRLDDEGPLPNSHQALLAALTGIGGRPLTGHKGQITCVAISPDSRWIATGSTDKTARIWDLTAENPAANPRMLIGHQSQINSVAISPDGRWVVTGSNDKTARVWDLTVQNPVANPRVLAGHQGRIDSMAISRDSRWIVTVSLDQTARAWDLTAENPAENPCVLGGHQADITSMAISLDSRWVVTGSADQTARAWDLTAENPAAAPCVLTGHQGLVASLTISATSRWLVTGSYDNTARVWDLTSDNPAATSLVLSGHQAQIHRVAISPDSRWIVTVGLDQTARAWDLTAENPTAKSRVLSGLHDYASLAISPDSRWIVTGGDDNTARVWDLTAENSADRPRVLSGHQDRIDCVAITPDSRWLVTGSIDKTVRIWDLAQDNPATNSRVLSGHESAIAGMEISPNGRWLVTVSGGNPFATASDCAVRVWDLTARNPAANSRVLSGHQSWSASVELSGDGHRIVTGCSDGTVRVWDLSADGPSVKPRELIGHTAAIICVAISADSRWVVTGSADKTARVWDLMAENPSASALALIGHDGVITGVAISRNGRWVATASGTFKSGTDWLRYSDDDDGARVWDLQAEQPAKSSRILSRLQKAITTLAFSPDNRWIALGSEDKTVRVCEVAAGGPDIDSCVLTGHQDWIYSMAISPDSRWIVTGSSDKTARIWDLKAENPAADPRVLAGHQNAINTVAISPDGRWVVTGSDDKTARVWDLTAENPAANPRVLTGHQIGITSAVFSLDSRWIVTGSEDKTARIWDLAADNPSATPRVLSGHKAQIHSVAFSHDNRWIVTGSHDKTARVWRWQWDDLLALARAVGRNFDREEWKLYFPDEPYRKTFPELPARGDQ